MAMVACTQEDAHKYFPILSMRLTERKLACEHGPARFAGADEFMCMHRNESRTEVGFKHRNTRNYIFLRLRWDKDLLQDVWVLDVPFTTIPFNLGFFDL